MMAHWRADVQIMPFHCPDDTQALSQLYGVGNGKKWESNRASYSTEQASQSCEACCGDAAPESRHVGT